MSILSDIADFVLPRHCPVCQKQMVKGEKGICLTCLSDLPKTNAHLIEENPIEKLFWTFLPIERVTSFFFYNSMKSHQTIYHTKYFSHPKIGEIIAREMSEELKDANFFDGIDIIVTIPLHWRRKMQRGYNQSDFIARGINQATGIPIASNVVKRMVNNESQTHMRTSDRRKNVQGIFQLTHPERVRGKHILLVDDVITTGSTIISCGQELMKAGDVRFSVLSLDYAGEPFYREQTITE